MKEGMKSAILKIVMFLIAVGLLANAIMIFNMLGNLFK